jgi:hypothetical protein
VFLSIQAAILQGRRQGRNSGFAAKFTKDFHRE